MSRLYGMLATAENREKAIIDAIPAMQLRPAAEGAHPHLLVTYQGAELDIIVMPLANGVTLQTASNAPSGLWDLYVLVADSRDVPEAHWRWLARAWRWLRARASADPGWILGPWSIAYVVQTWPALANAYLRSGGSWSFPILAGDRAELVALVDYRPTALEITNDTDPEVPLC